MKIRIGQGYDVHPLVLDRKLILGGVTIPFAKGLLGHSDADVLLHAITDSLLGAVALGDIGKFFPDDAATYKGANSRVLLKEAYHAVLNENWRIINLDCTIIAEKPKLRNYIDLMRINIAEDLKIKLQDINIKAKTNEKLGYLGNQEAIEAQAIVLLTQL